MVIEIYLFFKGLRKVSHFMEKEDNDVGHNLKIFATLYLIVEGRNGLANLNDSDLVSFSNANHYRLLDVTMLMTIE